MFGNSCITRATAVGLPWLTVMTDVIQTGIIELSTVGCDCAVGADRCSVMDPRRALSLVITEHPVRAGVEWV